MILYLAGPMTGHDDWNYPKFHDAAAALRELGYVVLNPAETEGDPAKPWAWWLRRALRQVTEADGLALLAGWGASRGALLEVQVAGALGMEIAPVHEWLAAQRGPEVHRG